MANTLPLGMNNEMEKKKRKAQANSAVRQVKPKVPQSKDGFSINNPQAPEVPKVRRDPTTGVLNGVDLPGGDSFTDLTPDEVKKIIDNYNNDRAEPAGTMTQKEQIAADYAKQQAVQDYARSQAPPNLNSQETAQIGQLDPTVINSQTPLDQSIKGTLQNYNTASQPLSQDIAQLKEGNLFPLVPAFNKVTGIFARINAFGVSGSDLLNALSSKRGTREYLQDYNSGDNIISIRKNINLADQQISDAVDFARQTENNPINNKIAIENYNQAISKKYKSIAQLSKIADGDQRAYTDSIKDDLTALDEYFNNGGKERDDAAFYAALNKPTLKYLPQQTGVQ